MYFSVKINILKVQVMAEIKIEKKKPLWPWIIAMVLIFAVIYFVFLRDSQAQNDNSVEIENIIGADNATN